MSKPDGGPAFPHIAKAQYQGMGGLVTEQITANGMSLRDYFAAAALNGLYANSNDAFLLVCAEEAKKNGHTRQSTYFALEAYEAADAMLAEREKEAA